MSQQLVDTAVQPCQGRFGPFKCHKLGTFNKFLQKFLCLNCFEHEYTQRVLADLDNEMRF